MFYHFFIIVHPPEPLIFQEHSPHSIDILRRAKVRDSFWRIAHSTGIDRNTIRNYLRLALTTPHMMIGWPRLQRQSSVLHREAPELGVCAPLLPHRELLSDWLENDHLTLTKAHIKLDRMGIAVTYSTLYRYAREELGFGGQKVTIRMADTKPGEVAQVDFGKM